MLKLDNVHADLQKGDLIAVGIGGAIHVGVFSQVTKRKVLRFIRIDKDMSVGEINGKWNGILLKWESSPATPFTYERRFMVEWSRRQGGYYGYHESSSFNNSSFVPYHVDLLTDKQKENYKAIREFLRCVD